MMTWIRCPHLLYINLSEKYDVYFSYDVDIINNYEVIFKDASTGDVEKELKKILKKTDLKNIKSNF